MLEVLLFSFSRSLFILLHKEMLSKIRPDDGFNNGMFLLEVRD